MGNEIHPAAMVAADAELGDGNQIGPQAIIESGARIGDGNEIGAACRICGSVNMGNRNRLMQGASLGGEPQSKGYKGEPTQLIVGDENWFGEYTVIHRGTTAKEKTVIGDGLYMMNNAHIGHDATIGDHVVMAPAVNVGGLAQVGDRANLGAGAGIHQNNRVGALVMVGAMTPVTQDVLPFTMIAKEGVLFGLNAVGIKRTEGVPKEFALLKEAYRRFCQKRECLSDFQAWLCEQPDDPFLDAWKVFLAVPNPRGYARGRSSRRRAS